MGDPAGEEDVIKRRRSMKQIAWGALAPEANAVVCSRGVYRAGCARPRVVVVAHRPVAARDKARAIARTEAYAVSRRERKKVEMLFAHLKRILGVDRLRLRGPSGAKDEFLLAATAQNLRKLAKIVTLPAPIFAT
jgi:Transposase DDE domain